MDLSRRLLTIDEVAAHIGVDRDAVSRYIKNRELTAINVARTLNCRPRWRVSIEAIEAFLRSRQTDAKVHSAPKPIKKPTRIGRDWI